MLTLASSTKRWLTQGAVASTMALLVACEAEPAPTSRLRRTSQARLEGVQGRVKGAGASGLRVREQPMTTSRQLATLKDGAIVTIQCQVEGETIDGNRLWDFVDAEGGYVADAYVSIAASEDALPRCGDEAPVATQAPPVVDEPSGGATVDIEGPPVQPHVQAFANDACRQVDACRAATRDGHEPSGDLALDFPTGAGFGTLPTDGHVFGNALAEFAVANRGKHRIDYVIYRQRINFGDGWEPMEDRGDVTQNHFDHVHISFDP